MPFEHQYIEKYGQRALAAYQRSLPHSDLKTEIPKHSAQQQLQRSQSSCSRKSKNYTNKHSTKGTPKVMAQKRYQQPRPHINSLQLLVHPQKKKLVIADISTPKGTPMKPTQRKNQKGTTNVNVYVNAMQRSKSKQSTPCQQKGVRIRSKNEPPSSELLNQAISSLSSFFSSTDHKHVHRAFDTLQHLRRAFCRDGKRIRRQEHLVQKIRELVSSNPSRYFLAEDSQNDYLHQLESELEGHIQKEQHLLKIIESLSIKSGRGSQVPRSASSEEEDYC